MNIWEFPRCQSSPTESVLLSMKANHSNSYIYPDLSLDSFGKLSSTLRHLVLLHWVLIPHLRFRKVWFVLRRQVYRHCCGEMLKILLELLKRCEGLLN